MMHRPTTGIITPHRYATDLPGNTCATEVGNRTNPTTPMVSDLHRTQHQHRITRCRNPQRKWRSPRWLSAAKPIGIVGHKVAGLAKRILGITAHTTSFLTEHPLSEGPGRRHRTDGGDPSQEMIEMVPTSASLVGSMIIPEPIMFTIVRMVNR